MFLQLQRRLRHPFVQPHRVICLQDRGMGGTGNNRGTIAECHDASISFR